MKVQQDQSRLGWVLQLNECNAQPPWVVCLLWLLSLGMEGHIIFLAIHLAIMKSDPACAGIHCAGGTLGSMMSD